MRQGEPSSKLIFVRRIAAASALFLLLPVFPVFAAAENRPSLARLEVAVWPEYDRPEALVILRGFLAADVALPNTATVQIPTAVGVPHAVAKRGEDGQLLLAQFVRDVQGEWATLSIGTEVPEFRVEYYAPIVFNETRRSFRFEWRGGVEVGDLSYEIQQPAGATEFAAKPIPTRQVVGTDSLTYHFATLGKQKSGQRTVIELSYVKRAGGLTAEVLEGKRPVVGSSNAAAPATVAKNAGSSDSGPSTWLLVAVIGFAIALGGVWVVVSQGGSSSEKAREEGEVADA